MIKPKGTDGQNAEPILIDEEWDLIRAVRRTTIFDNAQPPCRNLIVNAMIQENNAVGDVFFQALSA